jgi:hypothetical protein
MIKSFFSKVRLVIAVGCVLLFGLVVTGSTPSTVAGYSEGNLPTIAVSQSILPLCRFGVGGPSDISTYPVQDLRLSWYLDWNASSTSVPPAGMEYMPMVHISQTDLNNYTYTPDQAKLEAMATSHPGMVWLIGNEPDRRRWQDDVEPHVYARAYHDVYHILKTADPKAQIAAGGIVQPTPVRLLYLEMVLDSYHQLYRTAMPVDVWNIHAFILREKSCDYYPEDCWGAEIPPGIDWPEGELYEIEDNDNLVVFKQFVQNFRTWMASRGYQDRPLIITEFGVQMPQAYGFTAERVNAYMNATFDYLRTATGATGYPADEYRLVQRWAWYSLTDSTLNSWLYDSPTQRTVFGDNWATYVAQIPHYVNFAPVKLWTIPPAPFSTTEPVTLTLGATIVNNGNVLFPNSTVVRFYSGTPFTGQQIGTDQLVTYLPGCAATTAVSVTMASVLPGNYPVYVVVDPDNEILESNTEDNVLVGQVLVATDRMFLPLLAKQW